MVVLDVLSLVACVATPYVVALGLRRVIHIQHTQLSSPDLTKEVGRGKLMWKPHKKLRSLWGLSFALMGLATWRVTRRGVPLAQPLLAYACLLGSSALAWPPLFFGGHSRPRAFMELMVWLGSVWWVVRLYHEVDRTAAYMLLPFLAMSSFSTFLINCSFHARPQVVEEATRLSALKRSRKGDLYASERSPEVVHPLTPHPVPRRLSLSEAIASFTPAPAATPFAPIPTPGERRTTDSEGREIPSPTAFNRIGSLISRGSQGLESQGSREAVSPLAGASQLLRRLSSGLHQVSAPVMGPGSLLKSISTKVTEVVTHTLSPDRTEPTSPVPEESAVPSIPTSDSIPLHFFTCPGSAGFRVRGRNYLVDKQKWVPPAPDLKLFAMDLVSVAEPTYHIARYLPSLKASPYPFHFLWQVMVPGKPNISLTVTWCLDHDPVEAVQEALQRNNSVGSSVPWIPEDCALGPEASGSSFDSVTTDAGMRGTREGGRGTGEEVERSAHSSSAMEGQGLKNAHHRRSATQLSEGAALQGGTPQARHRRATTQLEGAPFTPKKEAAPPSSGGSGSWWGSTPAKAAAPSVGRQVEDPAKYAGCKPLDVALMRFIQGAGEGASEEETIEERKSQFKIIPRIEEGGWMVKKAVGQNTPVLLGRKITTKFFRGPNYMEVDVDVGSSNSAAYVVGMVQGALKTLVIDIAVLLEGRCPEELPEKLIGTVRLVHLDLAAAGELDLTTGVITRKPET